MSTFNTRKDRNPDGTPKAHNLKQYDRYPSMRAFYNKSPAWWNRMYTTKRRRANDRQNLYLVIDGQDPESLLWLPDSFPQIFYW